MAETYWNTEDDYLIICPYCGQETKPSYEDTYIGNVCVDCYSEKVQTVTCDSCGKQYTIEPYQSGWNYKTETIDGEMTQEEWERRYS